MSGIGAFPKRDRQRGRPLMSIKELAEDLGVSAQVLGGLLARNGSPQRIIRSRSRTHQASYFDPVEVRSWWGQLKGTKS